MERRVELNDPCAIYTLGRHYNLAGLGLSQDDTKAANLVNRAADLGLCDAHFRIARAYQSGEGVEFGDGVEQDLGKALYHFKHAALRGHELARHMLGIYDIAIKRSSMKHFMIAARSGFEPSLKNVGEGYKAGHITKDEYASTLRAYQQSIDEMKSEQRTKVIELSDEELKRWSI